MNNKIIKLIIITIVIVYSASYLVSETGYYEYELQQRTIITNEKIKEFEKDIKNNEAIDLNEYLEKEKHDYSNKFSTLVYNISNSSNEIARKTIKYIFKKLSTFIED